MACIGIQNFFKVPSSLMKKSRCCRIIVTRLMARIIVTRLMARIIVTRLIMPWHIQKNLSNLSEKKQ